MAYVVEGDTIRLAPTAGLVARTAGIPEAWPQLSADELRRAAKHAIAEEVVAKGVK